MAQWYPNLRTRAVGRLPDFLRESPTLPNPWARPWAPPRQGVSRAVARAMPLIGRVNPIMRPVDMARLVAEVANQAARQIAPMPVATNARQGWYQACVCTTPRPDLFGPEFVYAYSSTPDNCVSLCVANQGGWAIGQEGRAWALNPVAGNNDRSAVLARLHPSTGLYRAQITRVLSRPAGLGTTRPVIRPAVRPMWWYPETELSPQLLPSIAPVFTPWIRPVGEPGVQPLPWHMLPRIGRIRDPRIMRQSGNGVPQITNNPDPRLDYWSSGANLVAGGTPVEVVVGAGGATIRPNTHRFATPEPGHRERKLKASQFVAYRIFAAAMNAYTETSDFVRAIHQAIPKDRRRANGKRVDYMLADIYREHRHIDWTEAAFNLVANQFEDAVIGRVSRMTDSRTERVFGSRYIGQGLGTRLDKAQGESNAFAWLSGGISAAHGALGFEK